MSQTQGPAAMFAIRACNPRARPATIEWIAHRPRIEHDMDDWS
ncbi:hypothetical protein [Variovorax soli]|nr:hypothetical protein [Variovorax soli]